MDTSIRGYRREETPPIPLVHIDISGVVNCLVVQYAYNTAYPRTLFQSDSYFSIPAVDLVLGNVYTMTIPKISIPDYVYLSDLSGRVHITARSTGCQGFYPIVVNSDFSSIPKDVGSSVSVTQLLNNANAKFILHCNSGINSQTRRYTMSVEVSPA